MISQSVTRSSIHRDTLCHKIIQTSEKKLNSPLAPTVVRTQWEPSTLSQQYGESPHSMHIGRLPAGNADEHLGEFATLCLTHGET